MDRPTMFEPYRGAADIEVLPSYFPIPGLGILPVNAFVLRAAQPVLVDTGLVALGDQFMAALSSVIDPPDLRWLWLTHTDLDHIGNLQRLLDAAPELRVVTTFIGLGKMSLGQAPPMDRIYLLNPGQSLDVGDRTLLAVKPPTFDAPETTGFLDTKSAALFSADCFGALMSEPVEDAAEIEPESLRQGMIKWATVDAPWLHLVEPARFAQSLDRVRALRPQAILSNHLPAVHDAGETLLRHLSAVPAAEPFVGPDQEGLETMVAKMTAP